MMSGNQKGFSTVVFAFAMVTLLSCCFSPVSSYFTLPRVSRTSDAIIIDYEGVGYSPFFLGKGYGQFVDPGFVPLPALNPYGMFFGGWPHFGRQAPAPAPAPAATCGKGPAPPARSMISERVAGSGSAAVTASKTWPFLVVLKKSTDTTPNTFFCSGTLISDSKVLLAAQCLEQLSVYEISTVTVLIGVIPGTTLTTSMTRRISKVVIHSGYNAATYANDIAIITLDMPIVVSLKIGPVCLPTASTDPDQFVDRDAAVMGWGPTTKGAASSAATFKQGKLTIGSVADCKSESYGRFVTDANICVAPGATTLTCPGDIGGPVVINTAPPTPGAAPVWTIVGINSYTADDACVVDPTATPTPKTGSSGLKTRVSAFSAWITTYMV